MTETYEELLTKKYAEEGTLRYPCGCRLESRPELTVHFCAEHQKAWQALIARSSVVVTS